MYFPKCWTIPFFLFFPFILSFFWYKQYTSSTHGSSNSTLYDTVAMHLPRFNAVKGDTLQSWQIHSVTKPDIYPTNQTRCSVQCLSCKTMTMWWQCKAPKLPVTLAVVASFWVKISTKDIKQRRGKHTEPGFKLSHIRGDMGGGSTGTWPYFWVYTHLKTLFSSIMRLKEIRLTSE